MRQHKLIKLNCRYEAAANAGFRFVEIGLPYDVDANILADTVRNLRLKHVLINTPDSKWLMLLYHHIEWLLLVIDITVPTQETSTFCLFQILNDRHFFLRSNWFQFALNVFFYGIIVERKRYPGADWFLRQGYAHQMTDRICVFCWITNKNGERLLLLFVGWLNTLASVIFLSPTIFLSRFHLDNHLSSSVFFHPSRHFPFKFTACLLYRSMTLLIDLIIIIFCKKKHLFDRWY